MNLDIAVFNFFHALSAGEPVRFLAVFLGRYLPYFLIGAFLVFVLRFKSGTRKRIFIFCYAVLAGLLARGLVVSAIRIFFPRPRPFAVFGFEPLIESGGSSFPSGHAALFFALAFAAFLFNKKFGGWLALLAFLVGVARVAAGVHYPSDVLGGATVALFVNAFLWIWLRKFWQRLDSGN